MKRPVVIDLILRLINFIFNILGIAIIAYALIRLMKLRLLASEKPKHHSDDWSDKLLSTWFIYLLVTMGTVLFVTSVCGCVATSVRSPTFLILYCAFLFGLMVTELGVTAYVFFDHRWEEDLIMNEKSGSLGSLYHFLKTHWTFIKWILVAALVLQAIALIMSLYLRHLCNHENNKEADEERRLVQPLPRSPTSHSVPSEALARPRSRELRTATRPGAEQGRAIARAREDAPRSAQPTTPRSPTVGTLPRQLTMVREHAAALEQPVAPLPRPPPPRKLNPGSSYSRQS